MAHKDSHSAQQIKLVKSLQGHSSENNILSLLKCNTNWQKHEMVIDLRLQNILKNNRASIQQELA